MRKFVLNLISFLVGTTLLTGCSTIGQKEGGFANVPPQTSGTIESIQSGNPSYAILKNVDIVKKKSDTRKSTLKVKLPNAHFISKNHWQSDGDTLDLFIGDNLNLMNGHITDNATYKNAFAGIVKSVSSNKMIIRKILYAHTSNSHAMKYTNQSVTIHLAPYTRVSLNGYGNASISNIKIGDAVLLTRIGPASDYIATQITDFHSINAAGWDMVNQS